MRGTALRWATARRTVQVVGVPSERLVVPIAVLLGTFGTELRHALTPFRGGGGPPPIADTLAGAVRRSGRSGGGGGGSRGGGGPPVWFGILNALVLYLGVVAAGLARTYS